MSKKQQRINKLISIYNAVNSPVKGASSKAQQCTYSKEKVEAVLSAIKDILELDGVLGMKVD